MANRSMQAKHARAISQRQSLGQAEATKAFYLAQPSKEAMRAFIQSACADVAVRRIVAPVKPSQAVVWGRYQPTERRAVSPMLQGGLARHCVA